MVYLWYTARILSEFDPARFFLSLPTQSHVQTTTILPLLLLNPLLLHRRLLQLFNPNPKVDYHALTRLLSQLFSRDTERLHIPLLVEMILAQPRVGTTIKTGNAGGGGGGRRSVCCAECC